MNDFPRNDNDFHFFPETLDQADLDGLDGVDFYACFDLSERGKYFTEPSTEVSLNPSPCFSDQSAISGSSYNSELSDSSSFEPDFGNIFDVSGFTLGVGGLGSQFPELEACELELGDFSAPVSDSSLLGLYSGKTSNVSRAPPTFKCWVQTCDHSREGFSTSKQRKTHYEKHHPSLILRCRAAGCKAHPFLRDQDRVKHESRMHPEHDRASSRSFQPASDATESLEANPSAADGLIKKEPSGERSVGTPEVELIGHSPTIPQSQRSSFAYSDGSGGFDTDSTWSGEESDWEDDEIDPNELLAQTILDSDVAVRPLLSPMKRELVNSIMKEFWVIFNQEWSANIRKCSEGSPDSTSSSVPHSKTMKENEGSKSGQKRKKDKDDGDDGLGEDGNRDPKKPKSKAATDAMVEENKKFACPYRKHDPRKYCHQVRSWRSCALTPLDTIARVKGHLYRYHRIFQCPRCKTLHQTSDELEQHVLAVKGCELNHDQPAEGITGNIEKQLKSRKKTHRAQSESERWQEMYKILFPLEEAPSPYFETAQDDITRSPNSEELNSYEEYTRRELPRFFRDALEAAIADETQPIEDRLKSHLVGMIHDCQDKVFSAYRSRRTADTPSFSQMPARIPPNSLELPSSVEEPQDIIETLFERAPPQTSFPFHSDIDVGGVNSKMPKQNMASDSGYFSDLQLLNSDSLNSEDIAASENITADSSQLQMSPETPQPTEKKDGKLTTVPPFTFYEPSTQQFQGYGFLDIPDLQFPESNVNQDFGYSTGYSMGFGGDLGKCTPPADEGIENSELWKSWPDSQR